MAHRRDLRLGHVVEFRVVAGDHPADPAHQLGVVVRRLALIWIRV
jgi:hypothetical protein